jgi:hypothetical protein
MPDADIHKLSHGHPDEELLFALEPDQLVAASSRPLPRYALSRAANLALWLLRGFVLIITALVVYTFILSLR